MHLVLLLVQNSAENLSRDKDISNKQHSKETKDLELYADEIHFCKIIRKTGCNGVKCPYMLSLWKI